MGNYPTGVTIVTTSDTEGNHCGLTVNSFASVSIDPLMVLWCLDKRSSSLKTFSNSSKFAVHILSQDQEELCWAFAGKDSERFSKANWCLSKDNLPILSGSLGVMECKMIHQIEAGDHYVFIGEIINLDVNKDKEPMLYFRRNVGSIPDGWPFKLEYSK